MFTLLPRKRFDLASQLTLAICAFVAVSCSKTSKTGEGDLAKSDVEQVLKSSSFYKGLAAAQFDNTNGSAYMPSPTPTPEPEPGSGGGMEGDGGGEGGGMGDGGGMGAGTPTPTPVVENTPAPTPVVENSPAPTPVVENSPAPTPVVENTPAPTPVVENTPAPTPVVENTPAPTPVVENTPAPTPVVENTPAPTPVVENTPAPTPVVENTPAPTPVVENTPAPTPVVENTPVPTPVVENTPAPTPVVENTPAPTPVVENTPAPTPVVENTPAPTPVVENTPAPTPVVENTPAPTPVVENTPAPTPTQVVENTPAPTEPPRDPASDPTPTPVVENTPAPTPTPVVENTPTPTPVASNEPEEPACKPEHKHKAHFRFLPVCTVKRSARADFEMFDEVKYPKLVIRVQGHVQQKTYETVKVGKKYQQKLVDVKNIKIDEILRQYNLNAIQDQLKNHTTVMNWPSLDISFDLEKLQAAYPSEWKKLKVMVYVYNDRNNNGKFDEGVEALLDADSSRWDNAKDLKKVRLTKITTLPKEWTMQVWAFRHRTLAKDKNLCAKQYSPIMLDLDGDGFMFSSSEPGLGGVLFDLNGDGKVWSGWPDKSAEDKNDRLDDGFLVLDRDRNGKITSGRELFGSATYLNSGELAENGFEAMKELDGNQDGKIDKNDPIWKDLRLWFDVNRNGVSESSELKKLDGYQIDHMVVDPYYEIYEVDPHGNETRQRSVYQKKLKKELSPFQMIDVWFHTLKMFL